MQGQRTMLIVRNSDTTLSVISHLQIVFMLSWTVYMVSQLYISYAAAVYQSEQGNCLVLPNLLCSTLLCLAKIPRRLNVE